ncbi:MAG TPA: hypothetical protein VNY52_06925 [Solirubrobacteraceae bacterium]|jgi:hypothetical protein|nr:hypothetical protein [Solirubrobacteraceae bacterium]
MIARRSLWRELVSLCVVVGGLLFVWSAPALAQREHVFSKAFGSEGAGDGQLSRPGALAVNDETGDVYVIDRGNGRVEIFSATGAYVSQFNGSAAPTGPFSFAGKPESSIAVDNSTNPLDPSKGDVYVVDDGHNLIDKFSSSGAYIGQVTGRSPSSPFLSLGFLHLTEIAVDSNGELWAQIGAVTGEPYMEIFNDALTNEYMSQIKVVPRFEGFRFTDNVALIGFALDSEDSFYIGLKPELSQKLTVPTKFSKTAEVLAGQLDGEETTGLAVDLSSDDVYVDHGTSVAAYGLAGSPLERFGAAQMQASEGIAVNSATGSVYTADTSSQAIDVFTAFVVPDVTTGLASSFAETSVTVGGVVNPDGLPVISCVFEYGTSESYGQSVECSPSPGSGSGPITVTAQLKGLQRLTMYHYRLSASNANGSNQGRDRTFVTPEPVALSEEGVSDVSSASALFSVQVDPGGADTTYDFEYGPSVSYGESLPVPAGDLGAGTSSESVSVRPEDLRGETTYHVRVVATNVLGAVYGPDETFTTQAGGGAFVLPDGREWEMVTPPIKGGAGIEPIGGTQAGQGGLIESSGDGSAISYVADAPLGAGIISNPTPFGPVQVLSRRGVGGWSSEDISAPQRAAAENADPGYNFFSTDLSRALVDLRGNLPLSPEATENTPYVRENSSGDYVPLVTASNVPPGTKFSSSESQEDSAALAATPDLSHVLFLSPDALTNNAIKLEGEFGDNLYEWSGGRLQLVNELPGGTVSRGIGGQNGSELSEFFWRHRLSNDGSRVFFKAAAHEGEKAALYMRDMVAGQTVRVDAPAPGVPQPPRNGAQFQISSADGSKVFFLDEEPLTLDSKAAPGNSELYVYDTVTGSLADLSVDQNAGEAVNVQNEVVGASEDGSIVYFVAKGVLASGAEPGKDNLYMESETGSSWSSPRLVAVLAEGDGNDWGAKARGGGPGYLTSRVSPNGRYLTFMSERSLTGYDNRDANSGQPDEELFLYDEATSELRCVSCNPTGARPDGLLDVGSLLPLVDYPGAWGGRWLAASIPEWTGLVNQTGNHGALEIAYQSRVLSDAGRLFFDSADALVAQDTNGREDVYEYEPQGVGGCARAGGCVSLISSGTSAEESEFLDASETGGDVFFLTAARLTAEDVDTSLDVYDAHVCSTAAPCGSAPVSLPPCSSGDSCKAAPASQPAIFGAPSSATFSGAGNVAPSSSLGGASTPQVAKRKPAHGKRKAKTKRKHRGGSHKSSRARKSLSARTRR